MRIKRDSSGWDPISGLTIKARGHPHHEAGSITAPRPKVAVMSKKVLAMRTPSIDAQV
jgi:hypothetical protein